MANWMMTFIQMIADVQRRTALGDPDDVDNIKAWLNQRQTDIWNRYRYLWALKTTSQTLSQSLSLYNLVADCDQPYDFYEIVNDKKLNRLDLRTVRGAYPDLASQTEDVPHTIVLLGRTAQDLPDKPIPNKQIITIPPPDRTMTLYYDYWPYCTELEDNGDVSLLHPQGHIGVVYGAAADGFLSKNNAEIAAFFENKYEQVIKKLIVLSHEVDRAHVVKLGTRYRGRTSQVEEGEAPWQRDLQV